MANSNKRVPRWIDVKNARTQGMKEMLEVVTYVLTSKQGFKKDDIDDMMQNISYVLESVSEKRLDMKDIRDTIRDEVKVAFTTGK